MGLRNKALTYREKGPELNYLDNIIKSHSGDPQEIRELKKNIEVHINSLRKELDRKLLDMQTLFEIGKEINSTLHLKEQIEIIIFTLMGQFRISDIAVYGIKDGKSGLIEKKGFEGLTELSGDDRFSLFLSNLNRSASIQEIREYTGQYNVLLKNNAALIAPVKNRDKLTALIILGSKTDGETYSSDDSSFLYTLAALSGVAIENARLYGELEESNKKLKTKLSELSALYEISKVINSSGDFQAVLDLITETITTGFGVNKAVFTLIEDAGPVVKKVIGLPDALLNRKLDIRPDEDRLFLENCAGIISVAGRIDETGEGLDTYLFMPLVSSGARIGSICIFDFENYSIKEENPDLVSLFSIIASQIAAPLALTRQLNINSRLEDAPYDSLIRTLQNELDRAAKFGVALHMAMLKFKNLPKYMTEFGDRASSDKISEFRDKIVNLCPNTSSVIRYSGDKILIVLPELFDSDLNDIKNSILNASREFFKNDKRINIGTEISIVDCSDEKKGLVTLLHSIE